ncbi:MAG: MBL fold metallo-hydrolase, partial [Oscillospiraceae bacterium]|nr:MBL fold metallo-hydrolase [Oscillospiraceae bacterium]
ALTWHGARYTQLDVGQGDAAVLQTEGRVLVIDTGSQGTSGLLDYLRHEGLSIDTLYISHPHEDHAGALVDVLAAGIPVGRILLSDDLDEARMDAPAREALLTAQQRGIPIGGLHAGERESWGTGSAVEVLGPRPRSAAQDVNDRSLVLRFTVAGVRILTTGDVTQRAEPLAQVDCDVLKVAHHGSGAATGTDFLRAAGPRLALIGVGRRNLYGHPTPETLSRLFQAGARVLRTDQGGALLLTLADGQVRAQTFLSAEGVQ